MNELETPKLLFYSIETAKNLKKIRNFQGTLNITVAGISVPPKINSDVPFHVLFHVLCPWVCCHSQPPAYASPYQGPVLVSQITLYHWVLRGLSAGKFMSSRWDGEHLKQ